MWLTWQCTGRGCLPALLLFLLLLLMLGEVIWCIIPEDGLDPPSVHLNT